MLLNPRVPIEIAGLQWAKDVGDCVRVVGDCIAFVSGCGRLVVTP